jgi:hypothetical protein
MPEPDSQTLGVVIRAEKSTWKVDPRLTRRARPSLGPAKAGWVETF